MKGNKGEEGVGLTNGAREGGMMGKTGKREEAAPLKKQKTAQLPCEFSVTRVVYF